MRNLLLILCLALVPNLAQAGTTQKTFTKIGALSAVAMNAGAPALTFYIDYKVHGHPYAMRGPSVLLMNMQYDYTSQAGTITTTCYGGPARATATSYLTTCTVASGTCTLNWAGIFVTASLSADTKWGQELGLKGTWPVIKCVVAHSVPAATEDISVDWYLTWSE